MNFNTVKSIDLIIINENMKIGTITTHMADNYGAVLQAFALSTYINSFCPCEIINYYPEYARSSYRLKTKIQNPKSFVYHVYDSLYLNERRKRKERFSTFREKYLKLSQECHNYDELKEISSQYQVIIAGSDQIWNPGLHKFDENYFLTFCQDKVKKYGYAPSFGVSELKKKDQKIVKLRCEGFSDIAFREKSGIEIARKLFGKDFQFVLDPVFLLNKQQWSRLLSNITPKKPYYLCYYLSDPRNSVKHVCELGKKNGVDVFSIGYSIMDCLNNAKKLYDLGPLEFLAYIYNAECIFTDSFHATAFSIIFNRPFYTRIDGKNAKRSDRIISLIDSLDLSDRAYAETDICNMDFSKEIKYGRTNELLSTFVQESQSYIRSIIENGSSNVKIQTETLKDLKAYCGYASQETKLQTSSSGGFAAAMSDFILRLNGVVYSVAYTEDFKGAEYIRIDDIEKLPALAGSKYIRSSGITKELIQNVRTDLSQNQKVLFIGLPCEIAALRNVISKNNYDFSNLICVDLICHGTTYPKVQEEFINALERKYGGKITGFSVRYKNPNWSPSYVRAIFDNGKEYIRELGYTEFGEAFRKMPQSGCLKCKFKGANHRADITIGDYWGIPKNSEAYNKKGVSVAFVHNEKGNDFICSLDNIRLFSANSRFAIEHNLNYAFPVEENEDYNSFRTDFKQLGLHAACVRHYSRRDRIMMNTPQCIISILKALRGETK